MIKTFFLQKGGLCRELFYFIPSHQLSDPWKVSVLYNLAVTILFAGEWSLFSSHVLGFHSCPCEVSPYPTVLAHVWRAVTMYHRGIFLFCCSLSHQQPMPWIKDPYCSVGVFLIFPILTPVVNHFFGLGEGDMLTLR